MQKQIKLGLIGLGYWGPNIARVLTENIHVDNLIVFDLEYEKAKAVSDRSVKIKVAWNEDEIFNDASIDAVVIATPVSTHSALVKKALQHGKHVFCEKPISIYVNDILEVEKVANHAGKIVMVGHIFEFNNVVRYLRQQVTDQVLGRVYYLDFIRKGLGPIRNDVNVIADLACHDISMANFLLGNLPVAVSAIATQFFDNGKEDIASVHLFYPNRITANIHVSWLDAIKQRQVKIVAEKKLLIFDDVSTQEKLRIIDAGKQYQDISGSFSSFQHKVKDGDITIPNIEYKEPLVEEMSHFIECITQHKKPLTGIASALGVTKVLEAVAVSIANQGKSVPL